MVYLLTLKVSNTGTGTIDIKGIGVITGGPEYGVEGTIDIGNTATADVTFDGTEYAFDGALTVTSTATGDKILFTGGAATTIQANLMRFNLILELSSWLLRLH